MNINVRLSTLKSIYFDICSYPHYVCQRLFEDCDFNCMHDIYMQKEMPVYKRVGGGGHCYLRDNFT